MQGLPQAVLLDLDDTIIDDSGSMQACWDEACFAVEGELDGITSESLMAAIEVHRTWFWSDPARHREGRLDLRAATTGIVRKALLDLGHDAAELAALIANSYRDLREERQSLFPGAIETLERLRDAGVRLGLMTNGSARSQRAKIERFQLARYFESIVIEGEFGRGKPEPEVYAALLRDLRTSPEDAWSAGDNLEWDVGAPQRMGITGIWVDAFRKGLPPDSSVRPHRIVHSLSELVQA